jgi:hypothetical protein
MGITDPLVHMVRRMRQRTTELERHREELQGQRAELQRRWDALGKEVEAERCKLKLAEATMELMGLQDEKRILEDEEDGEDESWGQGEEEEEGGRGAARREEDTKSITEAQASVISQINALSLTLSRRLTLLPLSQAAAGPSGGCKRPQPDYEDGGPRLSLVTALPLSVWQEHLTPMLSTSEAAGLRGVCKALKGVMDDCPIELKSYVRAADLDAALTCFPATTRLCLTAYPYIVMAEEMRMTGLLREHGGTLKRVEIQGKGAERLLSYAVQAGALPNLTYFHFLLASPLHRQILAGGTLRLLEEVDVRIERAGGEQVVALEPLRRLPHLKSLRLICGGVPEAAFPPFTSPSLKTLRLGIDPPVTFERLLRDLPSTLRAGGAALQEIELDCKVGLPADCGAALAQVLLACSSSLKAFKLWRLQSAVGDACIRDLVPGLVRCCATLEVLYCPWPVFRALPATCPTFPRLTELNLVPRYERNPAFTPNVWNMMADGRLPALASLSTHLHTLPLSEEGGGRLARAFEAVGGTLRRLVLRQAGCPQGWDLPAGACYELGAAIGKLRRLRYLHLELFEDGRNHHAVGRGMAASGGCPELFEVSVSGLKRNLEWVTYEPSLIVPSVRDRPWLARIIHRGGGAGCCWPAACLVQMGYRYRIKTSELVH